METCDPKAAKTGLVGFLAGMTTGAVLGLLYAPQSGEETRKMISEKKDKAVDELKQNADKLTTVIEEKSAQLKGTYNQTRSEVEEEISRLEDRIEDLKTRGDRIQQLEERVAELEDTSKTTKSATKRARSSK